MGFDHDLVKGLAEHLDAHDIGVWLDAGEGTFAASDVAITYRAIPASPDRLVTLSPYPLTDDPSLSTSTVGVQVRVRGTVNPTVCDDLADSVFGVLHGATQLELSTGIRVTQVHRQSSAPLGQDANRRWSRADNYACTVHRPSAHRT